MNVNIDYEPTLGALVADVLRCEKLAETEQEACLKEIGKVIKEEVKALLPKSDEGHKHMRDDIKVTIDGKRKKTGAMGVVVHGGKDTAYKWHMLDDGTRNPNGTVHTKALKFTSKALKNAESQVEKIVNDYVGKVTNA